MALVTIGEIKEYSGFTENEFTINGERMTPGEFNSFLTTIIPKVTQMIHRYCNVVSFESLQITEYHNGRGTTNYDTSVVDYDPDNYIFFLKNLYLDNIVVEHNTATNTSVPTWVTRTKQSAVLAGDYDLYQENDVTRILFFNNIPGPGYNNVKFTYNTGYASNSVQLNDIKFQALRACNNILLTKKKIQEATTIRNYAVRDYSQMFDVFSEGHVLDEKIKGTLDQYRRAVIPAQFCYD